MIYIQHENNIVTSIHYMPFDEKHGLGKTEKELKLEGILVESIPEPIEQVGKVAELHYDEVTGIHYKYTDKPVTEEDKIIKLEQQVQQQNQAISDLTMMIAMNQTPSV